MKDKKIRKDFGKRIKELRKKKKWTQKELAAKLDCQFSIFNKYESGIHTPPPEKLIKVAELLDTTVDYLLTGSLSEKKPLNSIRLFERFRKLEDFNIEDQDTIIKLIDAMIVKQQVEGVIKPHLKS